MEAAPGVEPGMEVLQTSALPLGYAAVESESDHPAGPDKGQTAETLTLCAPPLGVRLERVKGLEPSTFCMASRRSSRLSYTRGQGGSIHKGVGAPQSAGGTAAGDDDEWD